MPRRRPDPRNRAMTPLPTVSLRTRSPPLVRRQTGTHRAPPLTADKATTVVHQHQLAPPAKGPQPRPATPAPAAAGHGKNRDLAWPATSPPRRVPASAGCQKTRPAGGQQGPRHSRAPTSLGPRPRAQPKHRRCKLHDQAPTHRMAAPDEGPGVHRTQARGRIHSSSATPGRSEVGRNSQF